MTDLQKQIQDLKEQYKQMAVVKNDGYVYSHQIGFVTGKTYVDKKVSGVNVLFIDGVEQTFPEGDLEYINRK